MLGGLDCIAMAVEHLERSETAPPRGSPVVAAAAAAVSEAAPAPAPAPRTAPSPPPPPARSSGSVGVCPPPLPPTAVVSGEHHYHHLHHFTMAPSVTAPPATQSSGAPNPTPHPAAFAKQPRLVSDAEEVAVAAASVSASAAATDKGEDAEDAVRIEELRAVIFAIDLAEWKTLSAPSESAVITTVTHHDVLCGRGGETNHHKGNIVFRMCVKACQPAYIEAKRRDKPYIAQRIVLFVRKMGGRFLKRERDSPADAWRDVGNNKAREKTSQALREGAPELRGDVAAKEPSGSSSPSNLGADLNHAVPRRPSFEYDLPAPPPPVYSMPPAYQHHPPYPAAPAAAPVHPGYRPSKKPRHHGHGPPPPPPHNYVADGHGSHRYGGYAPPPGVLLPAQEPSSAAIASSYEYSPPQPPMVLHPHPAGGYTRLPGSPRVTVSADEEERSSNSNPSSTPNSPVVSRNLQQRSQHPQQQHRGSDSSSSGSSMTKTHGPRLKLLKKRVAVDVGGQ